MIAFPKEPEPDDEPLARGPGGSCALDSLAEYRRGDLVLIRSQVASGVVPVDKMAKLTSDITALVENPATDERNKVAAFKALAVLHLGMLKLWAELHKAPAAQEASSVTNQQINIYMPANGREETNGHLTNGHAHNGRH